LVTIEISNKDFEKALKFLSSQFPAIKNHENLLPKQLAGDLSLNYAVSGTNDPLTIKVSFKP